MNQDHLTRLGKPEAQTSSPVIDGEVLLAGRSEIQIRLGNTVYRLRKTRQGKLILNK